MTSRFNRIWLVLLLSLTILITTGCAGRMSYRFVDLWLSWSIKDYVTLNKSQNVLLDTRMDELIEWHRRTQLPRYISWLQDIRQRLDQPFSASEFTAEFERLNGFIEDIVRQAEPDILELLVTLDDKQIAELQRNLQRKNDNMLEEYRDMAASKYHREREETARKNIQRWIGKLNRHQRVILKQWTQSLEDIGEERYISRIEWQEKFIEALAVRKAPLQFKQAMQTILFNSEQDRSEKYAQQLAANQLLTFNMLESIHQSMDKTQRKRLDANLVSWVETFTELNQSR